MHKECQWKIAQRTFTSIVNPLTVEHQITQFFWSKDSKDISELQSQLPSPPEAEEMQESQNTLTLKHIQTSNFQGLLLSPSEEEMQESCHRTSLQLLISVMWQNPKIWAKPYPGLFRDWILDCCSDFNLLLFRTKPAWSLNMKYSI